LPPYLTLSKCITGCKKKTLVVRIQDHAYLQQLQTDMTEAKIKTYNLVFELKLAAKNLKVQKQKTSLN
jgi:hypothetical protein